MNIIILSLIANTIPTGDLIITVQQQENRVGTHRLSPTRLREVMAMADHFRSLFLHKTTPELGHMALVSTGIELFDALLAPHWPLLPPTRHPDAPTLLWIRSPQPDCLHLPWEVLRPPGEAPWVQTPQRFLRRRGGDPSRTSSPQIPALALIPLRVLILVVTPGGTEDAEALAMGSAFQAMITTITAPLAGRVVHTPTFQETIREIHDFKPNLVILQGTTLVRAGKGFFMFTAEGGEPDPWTGEEIIAQGIKDSGVASILVCGRNPPHPPAWSASALVADGLAQSGIPIAVSWPDQVHTGPGGSFLRTFLQALAYGTPMDTALHQGRLVTLANRQHDTSLSWSIPMVFS
ncbi:MAG: hypothetical protein HQL07_15680 [Nitrospirae bacterium]|nr:hypothetical protein [Magnetococcales bacterium]HAT51553.1 hypothetical protein [Alphaproteobacteria bacterium]